MNLLKIYLIFYCEKERVLVYLPPSKYFATNNSILFLLSIISNFSKNSEDKIKFQGTNIINMLLICESIPSSNCNFCNRIKIGALSARLMNLVVGAFSFEIYVEEKV